MEIIRDFKTIDNLVGYDKKNNPQKLSIFDLLPIGVSWMVGNRKYEIKDNDKIIPLLLKDNNGIALIKAPFNNNKNQAWILNPDGVIKWSVSDIIRKNYNNATLSNVYYINNELYFFLNVNNNDFRFTFDVDTGIAGDLLQSR